MQHFHLRFKDEVEGRAEHAAKLVFALRKAANPEIDHIQAALFGRPGAGAVEEIKRVCRRRVNPIAEQQEIHRIAFPFNRGGGQNQLVLAIGGHKVNDGSRVF
ncbi:hypothetical protein D3C75_752040 [compost metagenome]